MYPVNPKRNILVNSFSTSGLRYREAYSALFFVCLFFLLLFCLFVFSLFLSSVSHRWKKNVKYMSLGTVHFLRGREGWWDLGGSPPKKNGLNGGAI